MEPDDGAPAWFVAGGSDAAVRQRDGLDDGEPQPCASVAAGRTGPPEALERVRQESGRETRPVVAYLDVDIGAADPGREHDDRSSGREAQRVTHQVADRLADPVRVDAGAQVRRDIDVSAQAGLGQPGLGGLVDPTVGGALVALGYDRDFVVGAASAPTAEPEPVPGWRSVTLEGTVLGLAAGVRLDLGATAKGLGSDRAAAAAYRTCGRGGLLVSLGGDIAVAGQPPGSRQGWRRSAPAREPG